MKRKWLYRIILVVLIAVFLVCAYFIYDYFKGSAQSKKTFDEIAAIVSSSDSNTNQGEASGDSDAQQAAPESVEASRLSALYELNNDTVGWLEVSGTGIDYPVMQSEDDDPEFYLYRNFYGESSSHGVPFVDVACDLEKPSDNIIIYGHHMKDGSMFAALMNYTEKSYFEEHSTLTFENRYGSKAKYNIIAAFASADFSQYNSVEFANEESFDEYYSRIKSLSFYDTGVTAQYGDELVTLVTCEYSNGINGRMVLVAVKAE